MHGHPLSTDNLSKISKIQTRCYIRCHNLRLNNQRIHRPVLSLPQQPYNLIEKWSLHFFRLSGLVPDVLLLRREGDLELVRLFLSESWEFIRGDDDALVFDGARVKDDAVDVLLAEVLDGEVSANCVVDDDVPEIEDVG